IKGITHVTGGGFYENFPRMLPKGLGVELDPSQWEEPAIFSFLEEKGNISREEMYGVFNMGVGMAIVVRKEREQAILDVLANAGEKASVIGKVTETEGVKLHS